MTYQEIKKEIRRRNVSIKSKFESIVQQPCRIYLSKKSRINDISVLFFISDIDRDKGYDKIFTNLVIKKFDLEFSFGKFNNIVVFNKRNLIDYEVVV